MKKLISIIACLALLTSCSSTTHKNVKATGKIISCTTINTDHVTTKGTSVPCLDDGPGIVLEALRGPAVVNVWGSWCAPCVQEMPHFVALAKLNKVPIIGIDVEESSMAAGKKFVLAHGMSWPILYDADGRTKSAFGMGVPVTWFLNEKSVVVYRQIGIINSDQMLFDEVKKYLKIKL
jgi:thiol-disulfide isomerase/thioredoxin